MVSLQDRLIKLNDIVYPIIGFEVWFSTPRGLCTTLNQAVEIVSSLGLDPELNVKAVSVAISDHDGVYEAI